MKKLVRLLMLSTIILTALLGLAVPVKAAETISFTLHKLVFPEDQMPTPSQNDGKERLKQYAGLNGVTYDVYDVTKDFYQLLAASVDQDPNKVQEELQGIDLSNRSYLARQTTATEADEDGIAKFALPARSGGKDAVYLFRESAAPSDVKSKAVDMIVALPLLTSEGTTLKEPIHLYSKNELNQLPFEKRLVDQQSSYQFGESLSYRLTTKLPSSLQMYSKFLISDQADESLLLEANSLKVEIGGQIFAGYQVETAVNGFKLNFDLTKLRPFTGKELTVSYKMTFNDKEQIDQAILNHAELETDFEKITRERRFKTGGKKFIKVDALKNEQTLGQAEFVIKNTKGEYLQQKNVGYQWTKKKEAALKLVSNQAGLFEIKGLRYGEYVLEEIKPPEGYVLSKEAVPFEVSENSYTFTNGLLRVVNQKSSVQQPPTGTPTATKKQAAVSATGSIPKMNDRRNLWLVIVGGGLVILVLVFAIQRNKKRSEYENEN